MDHRGEDNDLDLLVQQIKLVNDAWHTRQRLFGPTDHGALELRRCKDELQLLLLRWYGGSVELRADTVTVDGETAFHVFVHLSGRLDDACHIPASALPAEWRGAFAPAGNACTSVDPS